MADQGGTPTALDADKRLPEGAAARPSCPVVGIGASAGGIEAFKRLLAHMPTDSGMALVLIQHLAPDKESVLAEIMGHATAMPAIQADDGMPVEPNHVYVIPPGVALTMNDGKLRVSRDAPNAGRANPIDLFLLSLARSHGHNAACVILSGGGHDGTLGLRAIKEHGGLTLTQSTETATHDSMLRSAVRTGLVDFQLPVEEIPAKLVQYFDHLDGMQQQPKEQLEPSADQLRRICARVQAVTGHDFAEYKDRTLIRRIQRRMHVHQLGGVDDYIELLQRGRREADLLLKDLMIGVTQFFRDPEGFEVLAHDVLPKLLEGKTAQDEIRVWVAGCATGEEAYSIAILLHEALEGVAEPPAVQIFASDIDQDALQFARTGRYPSLIERDVSSARLERFFVKEDGTFRVRGVLRESCVFAQHNVLRDPPFSRLHLICCRNLLIYLSAKVQARLLPVLHYGLQDGGYLFLGPSESIGPHTRLFDPVDKKHRVFVRRKDGLHHLPKFPIGEMPQVPRFPTPAPPQEGRRAPVDVIGRMAEAVLAKYTPAYVIINDHFDIVSASRRTGRFLELAEGRPELNVLSMARTELRLELRAAVHQAAKTGEKVVHQNVQVPLNDATHTLDLIVEPLASDGQTCFVVVFQEPGGLRPQPQPVSGDGHERPRADVIAHLEAELRAAREHAQTVAEELETSNEELRSANEELSSVNEEMQSSNEELQTSKEELQSINEELHTVNAELSSRIDELSGANNYLKNLLENMQLPMVFLDNDLQLRNFTPAATELFSLRASDHGRPITEVAGKLDYARLDQDIRKVGRAGSSVEREVETTDGRAYIMRILPYRTTEDVIDGIILTFTDITERRRHEEHQKMLVAELSHRVKNTLATVQSIAGQTARGANSIETFSRNFNERLQALGRGHSLLTTRNWEGACLRDVLTETLEAYTAGRIALHGEEFELRPGAALALNLLVHELATNAAKHGALSTDGGRVEVVWGLADSEMGQVLRLVWHETGGPKVSEPEKRGFGLTLVERGMSHELDGEVDLDFAAEGLRCEFRIPYNPQNFRS